MRTKKRLKRIFCTALCLCMVLSMSVNANAAETEQDAGGVLRIAATPSAAQSI